MPSWSEMGSVFNTLRELDVSAIREEAERPVAIFCIGDRGIFEQLAPLLRAQNTNRHGPAGADPLFFRPLSAPGSDDELRRADLLLLLLDGRRPLPAAQTAPLGRLTALGVPTTILIVGAPSSAELGPPRPEFASAQIAVVPDLVAVGALAAVATAIFARLPGELHLAAARRLPGLRACYGEDLIGSVSFTNASFAVASSLPEQIPILSVPFVAADMVVLTKNQALMVYRLALAYGAPPEFKDRMAELAPVVGGGFLWRQLARSLIGLIPIWGVVPKVAVAYGGTYATGVAAQRWFADNEILSRARLRELTAEAMRLGRERAKALADSTRSTGEQARKGLAGIKLPQLPWQAKGGPKPPTDKDQAPGD
jgi:uncharacterized protein (DUF697 family)